MTKPLEGVRVIELGTFVFVPVAAAILADWGADVIKVEHPVLSDPGRRTAAWGVPAEVDGVSHLWEFNNRGKRSVAIDAADPAGNEVLMDLIDGADVFMTNLLPRTQRKLHLTPDELLARKPELIYGRGSAQGPRGELSERGGFDGLTYWGRSGAAHGVTPPDSDWPLAMPGPGFGDLQTGMALAGSIGTALFARSQHGRGTVVDVSLMSAGLWAMGLTISGTSVLGTDDLPHQHHADSPNPLVNQYRTKDGRFIALAFLQSDRYWPEFCVAVDHPEWLADERFTDSAARAENMTACIDMLEELFAERTLAEWEPVLAGQDGQWDVLAKPGEMRDDPQALANGYVQNVEHDGGGAVTLVPAPAQFDGEPAKLSAAPELGADTGEVLASHGYTEARIAALRNSGVVG